MSLLDAQQEFFRRFLKLGQFCIDNGYGVTFGEAHRPPEMCQIYANEGKGVVNSVHSLRLAVDLNLFRGSEFLVNLADYKTVGEYWKSLSDSSYSCRWGGDFVDRPDADHYSFFWNNVE